MIESVGVINLSTYLIGALVVILLPGPNSLFVLASAASKGVKSGYQAAFGVWLGDSILLALMTLGAGSLLQAIPVLFYGLRALGALYLLYLGLRILWSVFRPSASSVEVERITLSAEKNQRFFIRALLLSLINPKAILFLLSFFVQFVDPAQGNPWLAFLVLGAFLQLFSVLYLSLLIFSGYRLAAVFRRYTRLSALSNTAVALVFIAFAVRMAFGVV